MKKKQKEKKDERNWQGNQQHYHDCIHPPGNDTSHHSVLDLDKKVHELHNHKDVKPTC